MKDRALVVCDGGGIGDSLLASVVARALHSHYRVVDALTLAGHRSALEHVPDVDGVIADTGESAWRMARALGGRRYDAAVVTWATLRTALVPFLAGIPVRVGQSRRLYSTLFTRRVPVLSETGDTTTHWTQILLNYARALGCDTADTQPRFQTTPDDEAQAAAIWAQCGSTGAYALVHPTCAISSRRPIWPLEGWVALTRSLSQRYGYRLFVTGSEADREIAQRLAQYTGAVSLAGKTSIGAFAAIAKRAKFFVVMHSGPMHVAAAVGTPTVGIFPLQADFPDRWFPLGRAVTVVRPSYPCRPRERMETCPDYACVRSLCVDDVMTALERLSSQFER
ncbi:MAG: glycosyltransferase family 9 protein [Candidatus Eremiobacteraeota bacterium]|nr:glycosyltransferase family 9 protein [Candidatus Eremiobacteraeota bacterium]